MNSRLENRKLYNAYSTNASELKLYFSTLSNGFGYQNNYIMFYEHLTIFTQIERRKIRKKTHPTRLLKCK